VQQGYRKDNISYTPFQLVSVARLVTGLGTHSKHLLRLPFTLAVKAPCAPADRREMYMYGRFDFFLYPYIRQHAANAGG